MEIEVPSVLVGFALGGATLLAHRLVTSAAGGKSASQEAVPELSDGAERRRLAKGPLLAVLLILGLSAALLALEPGDLPEDEPLEALAPPEALAAPEAVAEAPAAPEGMLTIALTRQQLDIPQEDGGVYHKTAYWGQIAVGEPALPFSVVFDTGSGHLILPSTYCHSETCRSHKRYRRAASATAKDIDYDGLLVAPGELRDHITVSFGTGEVTGVFVEDVVCMGGEQPTGERAFNESMAAAIATQGAMEAQRSGQLPQGCLGLRMVAATDMSEDPFRDFQFDGVLGLGLSGLSQSPQFNVMHVLSSMTSGAVGQTPHLFSVFLAEGEAEESAITFGGYARERAEADLVWHDVHEPELGQWMVRIKSIRVGDGEPLSFCGDGTCRAIVDTGTSLIAVPSEAFPEMFELLLHPADSVGECKGPGPALHIELEGITVTLEPRDYALFESGAKSRVRALITQDEEEAEEDLCKAMLMAMDLPEPLGPKLFVLGEPVLRRYYTVYDSGASPRVGFARARHAAE